MQTFSFPMFSNQLKSVNQDQLDNFIDAYRKRDTEDGKDPDAHGVPGIQNELLAAIKAVIRHLYPGDLKPWVTPKVRRGISLESINHQLKHHTKSPEAYWSIDPGFVCLWFTRCNSNGRTTDIQYYLTSPAGQGITLHKSTKTRKTQNPKEHELLLAKTTGESLIVEGRLTKIIENSTPESAFTLLKKNIQKDNADRFISIDVRFGTGYNYDITSELNIDLVGEMIFQLPWFHEVEKNTDGAVRSSPQYLVNSVNNSTAQLVSWPSLLNKIDVDISSLSQPLHIASIVRANIQNGRLLSCEEVSV